MSETTTTAETTDETPVEGGKISYDANGDQALLKIAAARVIASEKRPYVSTALFAMVPVKVDGLGTLASDARARLYWDPAKVMEWPVEHLAGVLLHECDHFLRGHADRFTAMSEPASRARIFNIAGDSLINVDLRDERIPLPDGCVYVEHIEGATREMSAEQIYRLIVEKAEESCTCGDQQGQSGESGESGESGDQQGQGGQGGESDESGDQQGQGGEGGESGDQQGQGGQGGESDESGDQQGQGGQGQGGQGQQRDPNCPVHGNHGQGQPGDGDGQGQGQGIPQGWDCGSTADGIKRAYEQHGDAVDPGIDDDRADLIRQQVAVEVMNHAKNRGNVPAGMERWARELLDPVVDWRRELSSIIRRSFATIAGLRDYTYRRPSRRQAAMKGTGIILPSMRQPEPPKASVVVDTSGSVSDEELSWMLTEIQGLLRATGSSDRSVRVYACDAAAAQAQRVRRVQDIKLSGGGGTDMRVGIEAAMGEIQKPDVVIVCTDGYTPWPDEPLKGATLIVVLTNEGASDAVPDWARKVVINNR